MNRNTIHRTFRIAVAGALAILAAAPGWLHAQQPRRDRFERERQRLVREEIVDAGVSDPRVIDAMLATPRHEFVPAKWRAQAYFDMALPIGAQQTISSPFIVAYMTEALEPQPSDKVLEIGTGSGYQAAVLSPLVHQVYTIEIVQELGERAADTLKRLGYENVHARVGDGYLGWPEMAPFDKIIVTCSPEKVPQPLVDQLRDGGRLVIPVGERYQQTLYVYRKEKGKLVAEAMRPTLFVPMTGAAESQREVQPDPARPEVVNGSFEKALASADSGSAVLAGWYYQRQVEQHRDADAPDGQHYARLHNETPGRACRVLQGLPVDGRQVSRLTATAQVRYQNLSAGTSAAMRPKLLITFYDEQRRELGSVWLGPWAGSSSWRVVEDVLPVPMRAREAILRVDLLGNTGTLDVDAIRLQAHRR